jgi:hypothetical protein
MQEEEIGRGHWKLRKAGIEGEDRGGAALERGRQGSSQGGGRIEEKQRGGIGWEDRTGAWNRIAG